MRRRVGRHQRRSDYNRRNGSLMPLSFVNPELLGAPRGFNHGVLSDRLLFVAGQTAVGSDGRVVDGGMAAQWERALMNVLAVVSAAGGSETDIARMTVFITDRAAYLDARGDLSGIWRSLMGRHYPA